MTLDCGHTHDERRQELIRLGRESDLYSRFVQWFYAHGQGTFILSYTYLHREIHVPTCVRIHSYIHVPRPPNQPTNAAPSFQSPFQHTAHEHNLQTIDRTLGRLAKESLEREQERLLAHNRHRRQGQGHGRRGRGQLHPNQHDSSLLTATDEDEDEEDNEGGAGEEGVGAVGGEGEKEEGSDDLLFSSSSASSSREAGAGRGAGGLWGRGGRRGGGGVAVGSSPLRAEVGGAFGSGSEAGAVGEEGEETVTLSP